MRISVRTMGTAASLVTAIAGALMLSGCQTSGVLTEEPIAIEPDRARIQLNAAPRGITASTTYAAANGEEITELRRISAAGKGMVSYTILRDDLVYGTRPDPTRLGAHVAAWPKFDESDFDVSSPTPVYVGFGSGYYAVDRIETERCVAAVLWERSNSDDWQRSDAFVSLYYCTPPNLFLEESEIVALLDAIKTDYVPYRAGIKRLGLKDPDLSRVRDFSGRWEGVAERVAGTFDAGEDGGGNGTITAALSGSATTCDGHWERTGGRYGTGVSYGTWTMTCGNGLEAAGGYTATKPGEGFGFGRDGEGRHLRFNFE